MRSPFLSKMILFYDFEALRLQRRNFNAPSMPWYPQTACFQSPSFFLSHPHCPLYGTISIPCFYNQHHFLPFYDPAIVNDQQNILLPEYAHEPLSFPLLPIKQTIGVYGCNLNMFLYACLLNALEELTCRVTEKEAMEDGDDGIRVVIRPFSINSSRFKTQELSLPKNAEEEKINSLANVLPC